MNQPPGFVGVVSMKIHEDKCNEEQVSLVCNTILLGENPGSVWDMQLALWSIW
jgi:hypothetical protein